MQTQTKQTQAMPQSVVATINKARANMKHLKRIALGTFLIDYYCCGVQCSLQQYNLYKQGVKYSMNRILESTARLQGMYRLALNQSSKALKNNAMNEYDKLNEENIDNIDNNVYIDGLERDYSITMALCRIVLESLKIIKERGLTGYESICRSVEKIVKQLCTIPIEDAEIDCIIENSLCV